MAGINLHVYPSPILNESRMLRETRSSYETGLFDRVEVAGAWQPGLEREQPWHTGVTIRRFGRDTERDDLGRKALKTARVGIDILRHYRRQPVSVINCHSVAALPLCTALKASTGAKLIYDTHELETETSAQGGVKRPIVKATEASLMRSVDHTFVVGKSIENWYRNRYRGIHIDTLYNYPSRLDDQFEVSEGYFHQTFDLDPDTSIFLYQGVIAPGRGIDVLLEAFEQLGSRPWSLVIMGYGSWAADIEAKSDSMANLHFHPAVPPEHLLGYTSRADIGTSIIEPTTSLSYYLSAPNKLFQYLYCGLPVVASDIPEQRKLLGQTGAGVMLASVNAGEFIKAAEVAVELRTATPKVESARDDYSWEQYQPLIRKRYEDLLR